MTKIHGGRGVDFKKSPLIPAFRVRAEPGRLTTTRQVAAHPQPLRSRGGICRARVGRSLRSQAPAGRGSARPAATRLPRGYRRSEARPPCPRSSVTALGRGATPFPAGSRLPRRE